MKKIFFATLAIIAFVLFGENLFSQGVAINTDGTTANPSAMLDVKSTNAGILVPRLTLAQRGAISNPATGLLIFQTDNTPGFYYNTGTPAVPSWIKLSIPTDNFDDADADATNELQTISISGHDITLSDGGGTVTVPDNNTTYSAGNQLSLSGTTFNVTEGSGSGLDADLLDGQHYSDIQSWVNANDDNTTYSAGTGLTLTGTVFTPTFGTTAGSVSEGNHAHSTLTRGTGLTGNNYNGSTATTWAVDFGNATVAGNGTKAQGNFGQFQPHSTYTDFNTNPAYWGWNYVQGNTNAPNTNSSQWYRQVISLGSDYPARGTGGYSLEMAFPRFNTAAAGVWMRTIESGAFGGWTRIDGGANVSGTTNYVAKFTSANVVGNSQIFDNGTNVGVGTITPGWKLDIVGNARIGVNSSQNNIAALAVSAGQGNAETYRDIDLHGAWSAGEGHAITASHSTGITNIVGQIVFQHDSPGSRIKFGRLYHSGEQSTYPMELVSNGSNGILKLNSDSYSVYGPNSTWGAYLQVGGNGRVTTYASVVATNGNLHVDAANGAFATYINYYSQNNTYINGLGGNVGIGNTGPAYKLDVTGDIRSTNKIWANANGASYFRGGDDAELWDVNVGNTLGVYGVQNPAVATIRLGSGASDISGSGGNIGIGTTTPLQKLHVNGGNIALASIADQTSYTLLSYDNANSLWFISPTNASKIVLGVAHDWDRQISFTYTPGTTGVATGDLIIGQIDKNSAGWTHGITRFFTNGGERMRIDASGNVGIGTTPSSTYRLYSYAIQQTANGDGQATIYGYRTRDSQNDGTGYSAFSSNSAISSYNFWGDLYTFGTSGFCYNDYTRTGGVLGAESNGSYWGSLGYRGSNSVGYGVYGSSGYASGGGFLASNGQLVGVGGGFYGDLMGGWSRGELMGFTTSGEMYALYNDGNSYTEGYSADIVKTDDGRKAAYSVTSTELKVYDDGSYEINGNEIFVSFDKDFASMINPTQNPTITVSPVGGWAPLYIKEIRQDGFVVANDNYNGNNVKFSWIAVAERIDSENAELPKDIADDKFNENLKGFMFNENITNRNATPIWWDGSTLRFDAIPEKPIDEAAKKAEEERMKNQ